jgi:sorbitol-specific phosphotransferase system component IIC
MANDSGGSGKRHADVVTRVFPQAVSLLDYCNAVVDFQGSEKLFTVGDPASYHNLLNDTLLIPPAGRAEFVVTKVSKFPIRDTIGRLVSQCVRSNPAYHEQNCLALGYRSKTSNCDATMRTSNDTELYFVNTIQAIVTTQTWQLFANRVGKAVLDLCQRLPISSADSFPRAGEEIVRHIFSLPVFVPTENMCYIQVWIYHCIFSAEYSLYLTYSTLRQS